LQELNYQRGETKSLPRLTRRKISRGVWGSSPRKFSDFKSRRQDFKHILKRISLEIVLKRISLEIDKFFRKKTISFTFPSIFRDFLQISFRFEFPNNFLQLVQISFKKEIPFKMEALNISSVAKSGILSRDLGIF
jgi:hypothetical protein